MKRNPGCRLSVGLAAVLAVVGSAAAVGVSVAPVTATATPVNLVQNGSFETVAKQTSSFESVPAGNSTAIAGWTVITPALYSDSGRGSVDITSKHYFNAEDGKYSIDLAGSSGTPGGIYQNVTTTPGDEYSLTFWSGVNGIEAPGKKHTMAVSLNGSSLDTVKAVSVGLPVNWVENNVTFVASSTISQIEFADATPKDKYQGPTVDNVSLVEVPDVITASSATIPPQTTGVTFTDVPVATFTDSDPSAPITNFSATIQWGDGGTSSGAISQSGSTYTVSGTYSYAAHGTYEPEVDISSVEGGSATVDDSVTVADAVTSCTGEGCSGTVTTSDETVQVDSTSTTGTIETTVDPGDTGPDCGPDDVFRHAPDVVTYNGMGLNAPVVYTVTFDNASAAGEWYVPFEVCYQSPTPFTDYFGNTDVTTGLLPQCGNPVVPPCVQSITETPDPQGNPSDSGTVTETIVLPAIDPPKFH